MIAIVTRQNSDGTFDDIGMNNRTVTGHYKTEKNLLKFGIPEHFKKSGKVRVEFFVNSILMENKPFKTMHVTFHN